MEHTIAQILTEINTVKWIMIAVLVLFILIILGIIFISVQMMRFAKREFGSKEFYHEARDLLDKGLPDEVIQKAQTRIKSYPKDKYAHWFLAQAYNDKKQYGKALEVYTNLITIAPEWREKYIEPYLNGIKERLRSVKPEVVSD